VLRRLIVRLTLGDELLAFEFERNSLRHWRAKRALRTFNFKF
jgi:hypothetical protein